MLKEFIQNNANLSVPKNTEEYLNRMVEVFDSLVDFLRNPDKFPDPQINQLVTLLWSLIGNKDITVVLDQWNFPSVSFAVLGNNIEQQPILIIPRDFIIKVAEDPVFQLGMIVYMASQARDFYTGKIKEGSSDILTRRARAWEAQALLTLEEMAQKEGVQLTLNKYQLEILQENPNGLSSLPPELNYSTPIWQPPRFG
ncbi:MAG: hypothetical protein KatS3mg091_556 [Patescibacteria group bacterium]|nr:MAG: hypothetical protein KatS3mg091_556 [Patescibacteria group bacterium]